ncbi:MAG: capsule assembly Wzi family protein [Gemmatimonadota bacterium]
MRRILGCWGVVVAALTVSAAHTGLAAQTTPYVTNLDPAYTDLDVLVSEGLVRRIILGERPYSRAAFGRFVAEATARVEEREGAVSARSREALERLARRFDDPDEDPPLVRPRSSFVEVTGADSPSRPLRVGALDGSGIDGSLNPLLQRNQGRVLEDGFTGAFETELDIRWKEIAGGVHPRGWLSLPKGPEYMDADVTLLEAYARTVLGPVALELGRNHVELGYGNEGGTMLSHGARGLDMARIAMDRPVQLPGPFRVLGLWQASGLLADMGDNRDVPGSFLTVLRLSSRPTRFIEIGVNYMNLQGGEGSPDGNWRDRLHDLFLFWTDGGYLQISDKVVGLDLGLTLPAIHTDLFVNFMTTDDRGRFRQPASGVWEDAIWLAGARVQRVGPGGRFDVWGEWRHGGARIHAHQQFTSGMTLDRRLLGDVLGPNAASVEAGVDWTGPSSRIGVALAWERYSGDDYDWGLINGAVYPDFDWFRVSDNPDEIRRRVTATWSPLGLIDEMETSVRLGYEHVSRFAYTDESRDNLFAQVKVGFRW